MDFIESSVRRLHESVRRFIVPSTALCDVQALRAQIELRQRALKDIEVIRCRLRPFIRGKGGRRFDKSRRPACRSRVGYAQRRYGS